MENVTVNANDIASRLLSALVQDIAKVVVESMREEIAKVTDARLADLEEAIVKLEAEAVNESQVEDTVSDAFEREFDNRIERAMEDLDVADAVQEAVDEIFRNQRFQLKPV
jgi:hypothetical protein